MQLGDNGNSLLYADGCFLEKFFFFTPLESSSLCTLGCLCCWEFFVCPFLSLSLPTLCSSCAHAIDPHIFKRFARDINICEKQRRRMKKVCRTCERQTWKNIFSHIHNEKYCCIHVYVCSHYFFLSHSLSHSQWHLHAWWNFNRRWISFILSLLFIVQTYFRLFWHCEYQARRRLCRESSPVCVALLTPWEVPELRSTTTRDINSSNNNHFKEFDNRAYAVNEEKRKSILQIK